MSGRAPIKVAALLQNSKDQFGPTIKASGASLLAGWVEQIF